MKVLIWVVTMLTVGTVATILEIVGYRIGPFGMIGFVMAGVGIASGLCRAWDYRGMRSEINIAQDDEEIDKPTWECSKCHTKNPTAARCCKECGKYK